MNNCLFIGRLTKEIELKKTTNDKSYCFFTLAIPRKMDKEKTDFINCIAWGKTAEVLSKFIKKGERIAISGEMQSRTFEKDGKKVYVTELNVNDFSFIEPKKESTQTEQDAEQIEYPEQV